MDKISENDITQLINMFDLGTDSQVTNNMLTFCIRKQDAAIIAAVLREKIKEWYE